MERIRDLAGRVLLADLPLSRRASYLSFSLALFVALASQQFIGPVKSAIFFDVIGAEYEPLAKSLVLAVLVPLLFAYSLLASFVTSKVLVLCVCSVYAVIYLFIGFAFFASKGHPSAWLPWLLYYATETKGVIIMPMIWSVVADVTPPSICQAAFPPIFFMIQLGGICGSLVAVRVSSLGGEVSLIILQTVLLFVIVAFAYVACMWANPLPEAEPLGSEEPVNPEAGTVDSVAKPVGVEDQPRGSWYRSGVMAFYKASEGLWLLLSRPYVFMTFWVSYANLVPRTVLDYENTALINDALNSVEAKISYLGKVNLITNAGVALVTLFGTRFIVEMFGMRLSLCALPIAMFGCIVGLCADYGLRSSVISVIVSSIIAYSLNSPCKEMLYVRTSREIKYKAKSWSEMYGNQLMKLFGAQLNLWVNRRRPSCGNHCFHPFSTGAVVAVWTCIWIFIAVDVAKRHAQLGKAQKFVN